MNHPNLQLLRAYDNLDVYSQKTAGVEPLLGQMAAGVLARTMTMGAREEIARQKLEAEQLNEQFRALEHQDMAQAVQGLQHSHAPMLLPAGSDVPPGWDEGMVRLASVAAASGALLAKEAGVLKGLGSLGAGAAMGAKELAGGFSRGMVGAGKNVASAVGGAAKNVASSVGNMASAAGNAVRRAPGAFVQRASAVGQGASQAIENRLSAAGSQLAAGGVRQGRAIEQRMAGQAAPMTQGQKGLIRNERQDMGRVMAGGTPAPKLAPPSMAALAKPAKGPAPQAAAPSIPPVPGAKPAALAPPTKVLPAEKPAVGKLAPPPKAEVQPQAPVTPTPETPAASAAADEKKGPGIGETLLGKNWKSKALVGGALLGGGYVGLKALNAGLGFMSREPSPMSSMAPVGYQTPMGVNQYGYPQVGTPIY